MNEAAPLLEVRDLAKHFGAIRALDDFSMVIRPGEVVALAGDNGAGKTTLIKTISGVFRPTAGEIPPQGRADQLLDAAGSARPGHRDDLPGPRAGRQSLDRRQHLPRP